MLRAKNAIAPLDAATREYAGTLQAETRKRPGQASPRFRYGRTIVPNCSGFKRHSERRRTLSPTLRPNPAACTARLRETSRILSSLILLSATLVVSPARAEPTTRDADALEAVFDGQHRIGSSSDFLEKVERLTQAGQISAAIAAIDETSTAIAEAKKSILALIAATEPPNDDSIQQLEASLKQIVSTTSDFETAKQLLFLVAKQAELQPTLRSSIVAPLDMLVALNRRNESFSALDRHLLNAFHRFSSEEAAANTKIDDSAWQPASLSTAETVGQKFPGATWDFSSAGIANTGSHHVDFLFYQSPLQGNFEVECDVSQFSWRRAQVAYGGLWVSPLIERHTVEIGTLAATTRLPLTPPLARTSAWNHFRWVVGPDEAVAFVNGRRIFASPRSRDFDPWLAIRSSELDEGIVRHLRISGEPTVPERISLLGDSALSNWYSYYPSNRDPLATGHEFVLLDDAEKTLVGNRRPSLPRGCFDERVLYYLRPIREVGSIEYDFFYQAGRCAAHPTIGRDAYLLSPEGIKRHPLTNGSYELAGNDPGHAELEPKHQRGSAITLQNDAWNKVRIDVSSNGIKIVLNDQLVYEREAVDTRGLSFGLFHYADQEELRVKNVTWTGQWPKEIVKAPIPGTHDAELEAIDRSMEQLPAAFEHDFARDGFPKDKFFVLDGDEALHVKAGPDGLLIQRPGSTGYLNVRIAVNLSLQGDYDIEAHYTKLNCRPIDKGDSTVGLEVGLNRRGNDEKCSMLRRVQNPQRDDRHFLQCLRVRELNGKESREYFGIEPCEADSGTLRLARRGDQVYFLAADDNSRYFRLIAKEKCSVDDLKTHGVRLFSQIHDGGTTEVVWKKIAVRAEKISGAAGGNEPVILAKLNDQRAALPKRFVHDFTQVAPPASSFQRWSDFRPWKASPDGLLILSQRWLNADSSGIGFMRRVEGDFDISIRFKPLHVDLPVEGRYADIMLHTDFENRDHGRANVYFRTHHDGRTEFLAQAKTTDAAGKEVYTRLGAVPTKSVEGLRIARRGKLVFFLGKSPDSAVERLIQQSEFGDSALPVFGARVVTYVAGLNRQIELGLQSMSIHAEKITP